MTRRRVNDNDFLIKQEGANHRPGRVSAGRRSPVDRGAFFVGLVVLAADLKRAGQMITEISSEGFCLIYLPHHLPADLSDFFDQMAGALQDHDNRRLEIIGLRRDMLLQVVPEEGQDALPEDSTPWARELPHRPRIRTGLFEPKSPLRGNGIFRAETKRPKRPWRFKDAGAETKSC